MELKIGHMLTTNISWRKNYSQRPVVKPRCKVRMELALKMPAVKLLRPIQFELITDSLKLNIKDSLIQRKPDIAFIVIGFQF